MIVTHLDKKDIKTTVGLILLAVIKITLPASIAFLLVWQSIDHAHLNRQIKKLSQKKEELYKKNYELKVGIASYTSAERMDSIYKKNNQVANFSNKKIITLILPPENKSFEIYK
jgi:cell division protein FtsL